MKLATISVSDSSSPYRQKLNPRDGQLIIVSDDGTKALNAPENFPTLISALENWDKAKPLLEEVSNNVNKGEGFATGNFKFMAPLPRTYGWLDGSAFIQHVILVRKARGAEPPEDLFTVPLMYQGISDVLLGANDDIQLADESYGMDFEGEVAVVVDDVPMATSAEDALKHIKLILLMNDVSLRNLIPRELATGFGFFHGKPSSAFAPFAVTPDELGDKWKDGRVHLPLVSWLNGEEYGRPDAGEMHFSFGQLIEHACKTRYLAAGTIIGSGTVSNKDESVGSSCLAEKRMLEQINEKKISTPFMKFGDTIEMEIELNNKSLFGRISQKVIKYKK